MTGKETQAFEAFWEHVRHAEEDVRQNCNSGWPTPAVVGGPWDEEFAQAYEAIRPALEPFIQMRLVNVPPNIPYRAIPGTADTWHQALMFFLNPPHEIYGSEEAFSSPEYLRMKEGAFRELQVLQSTTVYREEKLLKANASGKPKQKCSERIKAEVTRLLLAIFDHHLHQKGGTVLDPLTIKQIMALLPDLHWSQPTASRRMAAAFPEGGMKHYERWSGNPKVFSSAYDARTGLRVPIAPPQGDIAEDDD